MYGRHQAGLVFLLGRRGPSGEPVGLLDVLLKDILDQRCILSTRKLLGLSGSIKKKFFRLWRLGKNGDPK